MKKQLKFIAAIALYLLYFSVNAVSQNYAEIGSNDDTEGSEKYQFLPIMFSNSKTQALIQNSELIAGGILPGDTILGIQWYVDTDNTPSTSVYDIYYNDDHSGQLPSGNNFVTTGMALAGSALADTGQYNGWHEATFDNGIVWDGTDNIVIQVCRSGIQQPTADRISLFKGSNEIFKSGYTKTCSSYTSNKSLSERPYMRVVYAGPRMELVYNTNLSNGTTIALPLFKAQNSDPLNAQVDWGDGIIETFTTTGYHEHTYATEGIYTVKIGGQLTHFGNKQTQGIDKLTAVNSFGNLGLTSLKNAFYKATNLTSVPDVLPSGITSLYYTFSRATSFNYDISSWDVSNVTDMIGTFFGASSFNQDISNWNVGNVEKIYQMFSYATSFNQDIGNWNVSKVTNMGEMFCNATAFNHDIGSWNVSKVTSMSGAFSSATSFNQDISNWDVSEVTNMRQMFKNATSFNQDISMWNVSKVTFMVSMFYGATSFNQDISNWDVSKVTNMAFMFKSASSFDQDISSWDISKVTNLMSMFEKVTLSTVNYDAILNSWAEKVVKPGVTFGAGKSKYSPAARAARNKLTNSPNNWVINDYGIEKYEQTITFNALPAKTYGDAAFELSATGGASENTVNFSSSNTNVATISGSTITIVGAGTTIITASQAGNDDYEAADNILQTLTVNAKPITVTADAQTKVYGEADPVFTYSTDVDFVGDDAFTGTLTRAEGEDVGTYAIAKGNLALSTNYSLTFVANDFVITKAMLTVTADDKTITIGSAIPELTFSYRGFVNSESATVLDVEPIATTTATSESVAGDYAITVSGGSANNYDFTYVEGVLTIENCTGIKDVSADIQIFPNPVQDVLHIKTSEKTIQIALTDLSGSVIYQSSNTDKINVSNLASGIYILNINGKSQRFVKQ